MATKLEQLIINEVSGVDAAANMLDGWVVMKSRLTPEQRDALEKEVTRVIKSIEELGAALDAMMPDLVDAPDDVQAAAATLKAYCDEMTTDMGDTAEMAAAEAEAAETAKAASWRARVKKLLGFDDNDEADEVAIELTEDDVREVLESVFKAGPVLFDATSSYEGIRERVGEALQIMMPNTETPYRYSYVRDVTTDGKALISCYEGAGHDKTHLATFTGGRGDTPVKLAPHDEWTAVTTVWVAADNDAE